MILKNIHLIEPRTEYDGITDILIDDSGKVNIGEFEQSASDEVIDCTGLTAFPGLIDAHCHLREPGYEYKENIETGTKAAAKGGFTGIACMPNTNPVCDNSSIVCSILKKASEKGSVHVYPIGAISKGLLGKELAEMGDMKEAGIIAVSDDGRPVMSASLMKKAMIYASGFGLTCISHCEDIDLVDDGYMNEGYTSTMLGLRGITRAAEEVMISRELILSEYTALPVHIAHVSTKLGVELIRQAKKRGVKVTCETCPHYFTLTDEAVLGFDTNAKVNPPLREQSDIDAIIQGLKDGTIDIIATDHAPHHQDEKNVEFAMAANGISGFETAFGLAYTYLVKPGHLTLKQLICKMSIKPSEILHIENILKTGANADITIADLAQEYKVDVKSFVSKGKNSPYDGYELTGRIVMTIVDGKVRYRYGK